eukprot:332037-Prorocentrum_minimum.AAC.1
MFYRNYSNSSVVTRLIKSLMDIFSLSFHDWCPLGLYSLSPSAIGARFASSALYCRHRRQSWGETNSLVIKGLVKGLLTASVAVFHTCCPQLGIAKVPGERHGERRVQLLEPSRIGLLVNRLVKIESHPIQGLADGESDRLALLELLLLALDAVHLRASAAERAP